MFINYLTNFNLYFNFNEINIYLKFYFFTKIFVKTFAFLLLCNTYVFFYANYIKH